MITSQRYPNYIHHRRILHLLVNLGVIDNDEYVILLSYAYPHN
jgi:hypothetical protein